MIVTLVIIITVLSHTKDINVKQIRELLRTVICCHLSQLKYSTPQIPAV